MKNSYSIWKHLKCVWVHLLQSVEIHEISFEFLCHLNNWTFHVRDICVNMPNMASIHKCWTFSDDNSLLLLPMIFVCKWKINCYKASLPFLVNEMKVAIGVPYSFIRHNSILHLHGYLLMTIDHHYTKSKR